MMKTIHELHPNDYIKDEYGNYYEITGIKASYGKLTEVKLAQAFFEVSFQRLMTLDESEKEKYEHKHIGVYLQDIINSKIENSLQKYGKIYSIQELNDAGADVVFMDITKRHPRSKPVKK